jgi:putative peptidoglycan lipid II flippase
MVSAITICGKICGFGEKVVVAKYYGATRSSDVYFAVTSILWSVVFLAKELVHPSLLPVFSGALANSPGRSHTLFRRMLGQALAISGVAAAVTVVAAVPIVRLLLPGFAPPEVGAASALLRYLAPSFVLLSLTVVTYTCLNARKMFAISALGEAVLRLIMVLGLLVLGPIFGLGVLGPIVGAAGLICLLFHMAFLPEGRCILHSECTRPLDGEIAQVRRLILPLILGVTLSHVNGLADNLLASTLPQGQLSYLSYAKRTVDAVLLVGPVAVVTVVYSHASHLHATGRRAELVELINKAMRLLLYVSVPLACFLIALKAPLTEVLFQRGRFDLHAGEATADAVMVYAFGLACFALDGLFVYSFYAMANTRTPVVLGAIFVFVDIILAIGLMHPWQYLGIAAASVLAKTGKVVLLGLCLRRDLGKALAAGLGRFVMTLALASSAGWAVMWTCEKVAEGYKGPFAAGVLVITSLLLGTGAFAVCSHLLGIRELKSISSIVRGAFGTVLRLGRYANVP